MNLGIAFQLVDDALDYGGKAAKLGKNVGDDFREGKITLPVVLSFRRGSESERAFWSRTLEQGEVGDGDLETAIALMTKHRALEDTIGRARHYGAIASDALALFPASAMKRRWKRRSSSASPARTSACAGAGAAVGDQDGAGRDGRLLHRAGALIFIAQRRAHAASIGDAPNSRSPGRAAIAGGCCDRDPGR